MQIKNWPYWLFISSVSSCQLCCNRILSSRLHKTQCQRPLMVPLWPIHLWSIQLWNSSLVRECDKSVSQLLGARFCITRVSGSKGSAQSPSSMSLTLSQLYPLACSWRWGGKPDLCMSAKTDYRAGQWDPEPLTVRGCQRGSNLETSHCNAKLIQTDGTALECVPVTIAMMWNKKWEIISVPGACSTISVPAEHFIAALMFYIMVQWF